MDIAVHVQLLGKLDFQGISLLFPDDMHVFHIGKRNPPYQHWEPIYIGTHEDPLYDERLSWEGRSDKMTQVSQYFNFLL